MLRYGFHRKDTLIKEPVQTHALIPSSEVCAYLIQSYYNQLVIILLINLKMLLIFGNQNMYTCNFLFNRLHQFEIDDNKFLLNQ